MKFDSFEELAKYLREFDTWDHRGGYDFSGMVYLLGACLDNLRKFSLPIEMEELPGRLEPHQLAFLQRVIGMDDKKNVF